jgi:hypothetical protein
MRVHTHGYGGREEAYGSDGDVVPLAEVVVFRKVDCRRDDDVRARWIGMDRRSKLDQDLGSLSNDIHTRASQLDQPMKERRSKGRARARKGASQGEEGTESKGVCRDVHDSSRYW